MNEAPCELVSDLYEEDGKRIKRADAAEPEERGEGQHPYRQLCANCHLLLYTSLVVDPCHVIIQANFVGFYNGIVMPYKAFDILTTSMTVFQLGLLIFKRELAFFCGMIK